MAWTDLTISRSDIDAFEGASFSRYDASTILGIAINDEDVLDASKKELEDDIIRTLDHIKYDSETAFLDDLHSADERDILKRMLVYKFLANWFFQDSAKEDSLSWLKAREYVGKYYRALNGGLSSLTKNLSTPQNPPRYRLR